jgi:hypothetical protein
VVAKDQDSIEILQKIADTGECELLDGNPCSICPLARLKKRPDGTGWLSCFEAIAAPDFQDIKNRYKKAAESVLIEIAIEGAIKDGKKEVDD